MNVKALVAKKIGMTRMMNPEGHMVAVTLLQIEEQKNHQDPHRGS